MSATPRGRARLQDYSGKSLILFFYPKDDTSGCTREAVAFSQLQSRFLRRGCAILGVSRNSMADHTAFVAKHGLKVRLGSDEDGVVSSAYGAWREKQLYGKRFMGIVRCTFLIGPDGRIRHVWDKVRVEGHAEAVLAALE